MHIQQVYVESYTLSLNKMLHTAAPWVPAVTSAWAAAQLLLRSLLCSGAGGKYVWKLSMRQADRLCVRRWTDTLYRPCTAYYVDA